jgi:hypothetical protein
MNWAQVIRSLLFVLCLSIQLYTGFSQNKPTSPGSQREQTATSYLYSPGSGDRLEANAKISQHQKLIDDKNYEVTTAFRFPSINGGEQIDREVSERSQRLSETQHQVEKVIKRPDSNGRLTTAEMIQENHQVKGTTEETQRSYYRSDINGKMAAHTVENETITKASLNEKQITRALYRPDLEGKFSLAELEEGSERKVSDTMTIKESNRRLKQASGPMTVVEKLKETTTKLTEKSFKKETVVQQAGDDGRLVLTDKVTETQTENPDGTRKYQRLLESRNVNSVLRNLNNSSLILSQRVSGEERRLPDGSIESTTQVETIDPSNQSSGLRITEIVTEVSKPLPNGKVSVERIVKTRDVNGNYTVSQKIAQTLEPAR